VLDHVVEPNVMGFLRRVAGEMDHASAAEAEGVVIPTLPEEELATAAGVTEQVKEEMVRLRLWLMLTTMTLAERSGCPCGITRPPSAACLMHKIQSPQSWRDKLRS
jgi:hypothetical protein